MNALPKASLTNANDFIKSKIEYYKSLPEDEQNEIHKKLIGEINEREQEILTIKKQFMRNEGFKTTHFPMIEAYFKPQQGVEKSRKSEQKTNLTTKSLMKSKLVEEIYISPQKRELKLEKSTHFDSKALMQNYKNKSKKKDNYFVSIPYFEELSKRKFVYENPITKLKTPHVFQVFQKHDKNNRKTE